MKGIKCCGECAYYSMKKHKCTRGFTAGMASDSFFTDCDLPDVEIVKYGKWMGTVCTACGESDSLYFNHDFCPSCGAKMDGGDKE